MQDLITQAEQRHHRAPASIASTPHERRPDEIPQPTLPLTAISAADPNGLPLSRIGHVLFICGAILGSILMATAITLLLCSSCRAEPVTIWANLGGVSLHDAPGRNGFNPGLGLEARTSPAWAFGAGEFRNSERLTSHYATAIYTPWQPIHRVHAGALFGVVDGYPLRNRQPIPVAALVAEVRWQSVALTGTFIPTIDRAKAANTLGVQVKFCFGGL
jgi:hypothetical protein